MNNETGMKTDKHDKQFTNKIKHWIAICESSHIYIFFLNLSIYKRIEANF